MQMFLLKALMSERNSNRFDPQLRPPYFSLCLYCPQPVLVYGLTDLLSLLAEIADC